MGPREGEALELLERLGASRSEALIYLEALARGHVDVEEASSIAGVSVDEARSILGGMEARGLLRPSGELGAYLPASPDEAVDALLRPKVEEINAVLEGLRSTASRLRGLLEAIYAERRLGVKPEELLKPLASLRDMELQTVKMISEAEREVRIFTAGFGWLDKVYEELASARSRGVEVRVLMRVVDEESRRAAERLKSIGAEVRSQREPWYPLRGTMVDGRRLVFLIWATERKTTYYRPHYTENEGLIRVFMEAFNRRWEEAIPL